MSTAINCVVNQDMILDEIYPKIHLSMPLAYDNAFAHAMRITAFDRDKNPADLTGVGVVGNFKRSNGTTVTPILGTVTDNVAEILLPPSCYVVPGRFTFTMNLTQLADPEGVDEFDATVDYEKGDLVVYDGVVWRFTADHDAGAWTGSDAVLDGITRSAMWVEGHIDKNISGDIVDPGTPVGNIEQAIGNATAAATAAQSAATEASQAAAAAEQTVTNFAPAFDAATANAAGDYVTYTDGKLYLLPEGHTAGTSWENTTHTETDFGAEVSDLKSHLVEQSENPPTSPNNRIWFPPTPEGVDVPTWAEFSEVKNDLSVITVDDISPNLYNPAERTDGVILKTDGTTTENATYSTTGFMDVSGDVGDTVYFSYGYATTGVASTAYGYVFYGQDKSTVVAQSIGSWAKYAEVPSNAYYLRVSVSTNVMNSYYKVSTDESLTYVAYYAPTIKLVNQDDVDANTADIAALKNPVYPAFSTAFIKYPLMGGIRTDIYYQGVWFGNREKFVGFASGNCTVNKDSISTTPSNASTMTAMYLTSYLSNSENIQRTGGVQTVVVPSDTGAEATPKVLLIGDSHTAMGKYQYYADQYLQARGITPSWLGSLTSANGMHNEGRSGWRAYTYTQCANGSDDIPALSGTNAFLFDGDFDFSAYMTAQGYSGVDIVFIALGTNDFARGNHEGISEVAGYWQTMISSIHEYDSNTKIVLWLGTPPCDRNGIRGNAWFHTYESYQVIETFRGASWGHDNIYILPTVIAVDPIYDFPYTTTAPNATSEETVTVATDVVHLSDTGYAHLAYPVAGMIQYICGLS